MSTVTMKNVRLLSGEYEVTNDHNSLDIQFAKDANDATTFGHDSRIYRFDGLTTAEYSLGGFFDADSIDVIHDAQSGSQIVATIVAPDSDVAYSFRRVETALTPLSGKIGDLAEFDTSGRASGDMLRGVVLEPGVTPRATSDESDPVELTDIVAGQHGRAALHVLEVTGTATLDVDITSDVDDDFAGPSTYLSFVQATAPGAQFISSSVAESDTFWRAEWTIGGTGTVTFLVTFGIA